MKAKVRARDTHMQAVVVALVVAVAVTVVVVRWGKGCAGQLACDRRPHISQFACMCLSRVAKRQLCAATETATTGGQLRALAGTQAVAVELIRR